MLVASCGMEETDEFKSQTEMSSIENTDVLNSQDANKKHKISISEAGNIATNLFKQRKTRSSVGFAIDYVVSSPKTAYKRSLPSKDTLAYVFNRNDGKGFVIVSTDNRVFPILAFSQEGNFSYKEDTKDIVYANFISRLDNYIHNASNSDTTYTVPDDFLSTCQMPRLIDAVSWNQLQPYNKYVAKEYNKEYPVGCVPLAVARIMVYCKDSLDYHGSNYNFLSIRNAMPYEDNKETTNNKAPIFTFEQAVDSVAKILYWLGKDLKVSYSFDGTSAFSYKANDFLRNSGYKVNSYLTKYKPEDVAALIYNNGYIAYMDGRMTDGGHAWVIDGCTFCWKDIFGDKDTSSSNITNVFVHCDWGWGGSNNGYFSGEVFETTGATFFNCKYFAVQTNQELKFGLYKSHY